MYMLTTQIGQALTEIDKGTKRQLSAAQANQAVKAMKQLLRGPHALAILRGLLGSLALVVLVGCTALPSAFTDRLDRAAKDAGAGDFNLTCVLAKDTKQIAKVSGELTCTADMVQLTGCHPKSIQFEGPQ